MSKLTHSESIKHTTLSCSAEAEEIHRKVGSLRIRALSVAVRSLLGA